MADQAWYRSGETEEGDRANLEYASYPRGIRMTLLLIRSGERARMGNWDESQACYREYCQIEDIIVSRNVQGISLEKQLQLAEAIQLYEQNVAECVDTPHPYERLRIIYTKYKQYDDAIRVCQACVSACNTLREAILKEFGDADLAQSQADPLRFPEWISKLEKARSAFNSQKAK